MEPIVTKSQESYRQILKSTGILGVSSVINVILRMIRTKFMAIIIGPSGIGLLGIYNSITDLIMTASLMGVDSSGVRQMAEAAATGNNERIARTIITIRRVVLILGIFGMISLVIFSSSICNLTFKTSEYVPYIMLLSVIVLIETVMNGEIALIQGMRKISNLAKINIFSALFGTLLSLPILYIWSQQGLVPFMIAASFANLLTTSWYSRKIRVANIKMGWMEIYRTANPLIRLGYAIMVSMLISKGATYMVYVIVSRQLSIEMVGLYQAATIISSIYISFILDAIVKDYLPRLTAVANDKSKCNELINQQVEIGILLAIPGIMATLVFAPGMIQLFYSAKFAAAYEILRWQIMGIALKVVSWPIFFIIQAKGKGMLFFVTELIRNVLYIAFTWIGVSQFGLIGAGMAFFALYIVYFVLIYSVAHSLTGFTLSKMVLRIVYIALPALGLVFISRNYINNGLYLILGSLSTAVLIIYSLKSLIAILSPDGIAPLWNKFRTRFSGGNA